MAGAGRVPRLISLPDMSGSEAVHPLDAESAGWLADLSPAAAARDAALARLHRLLLRVAVHELRRRAPQVGIDGPELDDLAQQAADDALLAILAKLPTFRGASRFTTWAYRFVVLEVSNKLGRHFWRRRDVRLEARDWDRFPDRLGVDPARQAERVELVAAVRAAVDDTLTEHQRRVFVAIVVDGVPLDAFVERTGSSRNATYKTVSDARTKLRRSLVAQGILPVPGQVSTAAAAQGWARLDAFLRTDPRDVGCARALEILHVYADLVAGNGDAVTRYGGVAAHLEQCGPCAEDFHGLLAAVTAG